MVWLINRCCNSLALLFEDFNLMLPLHYNKSSKHKALPKCIKQADSSSLLLTFQGSESRNARRADAPKPTFPFTSCSGHTSSRHAKVTPPHFCLNANSKKNYSPTSISNKSLLMAVRGLRKQVIKQPKSSATEAQGCWNTPKPAWDVLQDISQTPDEWWLHAHSVTSQMPSSSSSPTGTSGFSAYSDGKGDGNVTKENEDWQEV